MNESFDEEFAKQAEKFLTNDTVIKGDEAALTEVVPVGDFSFLNGKMSSFQNTLQPMER